MSFIKANNCFSIPTLEIKYKVNDIYYILSTASAVWQFLQKIGWPLGVSVDFQVKFLVVLSPLNPITSLFWIVRREFLNFTRFAGCRCHRWVTPAIAVWVAVCPASTTPRRFAPGRRSIVHRDWRGCRFPPRALWFCVGVGYLSPTLRAHTKKEGPVNETNLKI